VGTANTALVTLGSDETVTQTVSVSAPTVRHRSRPHPRHLHLQPDREHHGRPHRLLHRDRHRHGGSDYVSLGTSVVIPAGATSVTKTVTPLQDSLQEPGETVTVTADATSLYAVSSTATTPRSRFVSDEAIAHYVTVEATDAVATEAGLTTGRFTFTRTGSTAAALTGYFTVAGTATAGSELRQPRHQRGDPGGGDDGHQDRHPAPGQPPRTERDRGGHAEPACDVRRGNAKTATVTLTSDETVTQTVLVTATDAAASEAAWRRAPSPSPGRGYGERLAVYFTVGGTATAGSDYVSLGTSVVIPAGRRAPPRPSPRCQDSLQEKKSRGRRSRSR